MLAGLLPLMIVTATLFTMSRLQQTSRLSVIAAAGYVVGVVFVIQRAIELLTFTFGPLATAATYHLPWNQLLSWSTLLYLALQYIVAVIVLGLLYRYDQTTAAWIAVLVIGSLGFVRLLV